MLRFTVHTHNHISHATDSNGRTLCDCATFALGHPKSQTITPTVVTGLNAVTLCLGSRQHLRRELQKLQAWSGIHGTDISAALTEIDKQDEAFEKYQKAA